MAHDSARRRLVLNLMRDLAGSSMIVALIGWAIVGSFGLVRAQHPSEHVELRPSASPAANRRWLPVTFKDPLIGKNFYLFDAIASSPDVQSLLARTPALARLREQRMARLAEAAATCGVDAACHARAFSWSGAEITEARTAFVGLAHEPLVEAFITHKLAGSGMFSRYGSATPVALLGSAWEDAVAGMNRAIDVYALDRKSVV